jgi:carbon-monoxide dehydrogenase small subunit
MDVDHQGLHVPEDAPLDVSIEVNGVERVLRVPPRWSLADALRDEAGLTGTHLGCEQGVCGACTVLLDGQPVRACLMLAVQADGHRVTTIEGMGDEDDLSPVQRAFHRNHALQCGFCTPGFVVLATALLEKEPDASEERIKDVLSSNLCRCTGYGRIVKAVQDAQKEIATS